MLQLRVCSLECLYIKILCVVKTVQGSTSGPAWYNRQMGFLSAGRSVGSVQNCILAFFSEQFKSLRNFKFFNKDASLLSPPLSPRTSQVFSLSKNSKYKRKRASVFVVSNYRDYVLDHESFGTLQCDATASPSLSLFFLQISVSVFHSAGKNYGKKNPCCWLTIRHKSNALFSWGNLRLACPLRYMQYIHMLCVELKSYFSLPRHTCGE